MNIYFNEKLHRYTDSYDNPYISSTTLIGEYVNKFSDKEVTIAKACARIGKNPHHPKYLKYKNKTYKQLLAEWKHISKVACNIGNAKHEYLELSIKNSNNFFSIFNTRYTNINSKGYVTLFTIDDIKKNPEVGKLNLQYFIDCGVKDKYPQIFHIIKTLVLDGWNVYSEVGVFNVDYLISGLIDVLFVKGDQFIILDWKTNKAPMMFDSGYWDKDYKGNITSYIKTDESFKEPLQHLPQSVGNKYTLQLSLYDWLTVQFGFKFIANILCHITHDIYIDTDSEVIKNKSLLNKNKVVIHPISYLEKETVTMIQDYNYKRTSGQLRINQ